MKLRILFALAFGACGGGTTGADSGAPGGSGGGGGMVPDAAGGGGAGGAVADAAPRDTAPAPVDLGAADLGGGMTGKSLDECFVGMRALKGSAQVATRASADGKYRMRLALETSDRGGTSGSYGYLPIRVAIETPDSRVCITDEAALATTYKGSHHNCADVLTVSADGRRYVVDNPDSAIDYADQTKWRRLAKLTVFAGSSMTAGPIEMPTIICDKSSFPDGKCRSGGPCQ